MTIRIGYGTLLFKKNTKRQQLIMKNCPQSGDAVLYDRNVVATGQSKDVKEFQTLLVHLNVHSLYYTENICHICLFCKNHFGAFSAQTYAAATVATVSGFASLNCTLAFLVVIIVLHSPAFTGSYKVVSPGPTIGAIVKLGSGCTKNAVEYRSGNMLSGFIVPNCSAVNCGNITLCRVDLSLSFESLCRRSATFITQVPRTGVAGRNSPV